MLLWWNPIHHLAFFSLFILFSLFSFNWVISKFLSSNSSILCSIYSNCIFHIIHWLLKLYNFCMVLFKLYSISLENSSFWTWFFFPISWLNCLNFLMAHWVYSKQVIFNSFLASPQNFIHLNLLENYYLLVMTYFLDFSYYL